MKGLKIIKYLLMLIIFSINTEVKAAANDTNVVGKLYDDMFAIQQYKEGGTRIFEAVMYLMGKGTGNEIGYCVQVGQPRNQQTYTSTSDYSKIGLTKEEADYIRLVAFYGYNYGSSHIGYKYFFAAQELMWEMLYEDEFYWVTFSDNGDENRIDVENEKKIISDFVDNHYVKPKFEETSISYGQTIEIEDKNNVLSDYQITGITNGTYRQNENILTITSTSLDDIIIRYKRKYKKNYKTEEMFYYATGSQNIASTSKIDDVVGEFKIRNTGVKVKINKKDATSKEPIKKSNIPFKIYDVDNNKYICNNNICEFYTNEDGIAITSNLLPGNYKLEEVDVKIDGYLYNSNSIDFVVNENNIINDKQYGEVIELDFYNYKPTGSIKINKTAEKFIVENNLFTYEEVRLENIEFNIITNQNITYNDKEYKTGDIIAIIKTNIEGIATIEKLPLGSYTIKEIYNNPLYEVNDEEYIVELKYKDQYTKIISYDINIKNILKKGSLKFRKIDNETKEGLSGVLIAIYDSNNTKIYENKTDKNGNIYIENIAYGKYYIKELEPLEEYKKTDLTIDFEISDELKIVETTMKNSKIELPPNTSNKTSSNINFIPITTLIIYLIKKTLKM